MNDLTKLTAAALDTMLNIWPEALEAEIRRRLQRLEKCEAALQLIASRELAWQDMIESARAALEETE